MRKSLLPLGLTCLSFGLFACEGEPPLVEISSSEAALTAAENSERALQGVLDAADFVASSRSIADSFAMLGGAVKECSSDAVPCSGDAGTCPEPEVTCTSSGAGEADLEALRQQLREQFTEFASELRERILTEDNLESETATSATYRLGPEDVCDPEDHPVATSGATGADPVTAESAEDPGATTALDPECVEQVERLEPRLRLTSPREGDIDLSLLLGAERHEPLTLQLHRHSLGVEVDLGQLFGLAREFGEDLDGVEELSGVLRLALVEHRERDYSLQLAVVRAVRVAIAADGEVLSASLGATSPAWNVRLDGNSNTLSAGLDLGAFELVGPLRLFTALFEGDVSASGSGSGTAADPLAAESDAETPRSPATGILELFWAGLSGTISYSADGDVLRFDDLGFGDTTSTLKHDGNTLFSLDLNAARGRRVNLVVEPGSDGESARVRIEPTFDLVVDYAFQHVADQFENLTGYLLDETLHVWFSGDDPVLELRDGQTRVAAGTLHFESSPTPSLSFDVNQGMCLLEAETAETAGDDHPFAGLSAATCQ